MELNELENVEVCTTCVTIGGGANWSNLLCIRLWCWRFPWLNGPFCSPHHHHSARKSPKISPPGADFQGYSAPSTIPLQNGTFSESCRQHLSTNTLFGTGTLLAVEHSRFGLGGEGVNLRHLRYPSATEDGSVRVVRVHTLVQKTSIDTTRPWRVLEKLVRVVPSTSSGC